MADKKLKLGVYWGAGCGGCDISTLEIAEKILKVIDIADIVMWPCIADFKYDDVRKYADGYIDVCLWNGGVRNSETKEIAELLRKKSKVLAAYGACSCFGGVPSLANLYTKDSILERAYKTTESTDNPKGILPQEKVTMPEGELHIPEFYSSVMRLKDVVDADYFIPGCPPTAKQTWNVIEAIASGKLPPKGSIVGVGDKSVCDECPFEKKTKDVRIERFKRPHLDKPDLTPRPELKNKPQCLLEQGFVCVGSATRSGCEAQCLKANMPCRGCYGPAEGVEDQGARAASAIGSLIDTKGDEKRGEAIAAGLVDPVGTFYRFGVTNSVLGRAKV
ncbi:MAG: oxidoreductase [Pseudomonadota bacterium]